MSRRVVRVFFLFGAVAVKIAAQSIILVPQQISSIQGAISASSAGDTILVAPGTYVESLNFLGKPITVRSSQGSAVTVIDAAMTDTVVKFETGEGANSVLEGFTLTAGRGANGTGFPSVISIANPGYAGGIHIVNASPTIRSCTVSNCRGGNGYGTGAAFGFLFGTAAERGGAGGIEISGGAPLIEDCRFVGNIGGNGGSRSSGAAYGNMAGSGGAGAAAIAGASGAIFRRVVFASNTGGNGGQMLYSGVSASITGFVGRGGSGAVDWIAGSATFENVALHTNSGGGAGAVAHVGLASSFNSPSGAGAISGSTGPVQPQLVFSHATVLANVAGSPGTSPVSAFRRSVDLRNSIVQGTFADTLSSIARSTNFSSPFAGPGNSTFQPLVTIDPAGIPHIDPWSPCVDAGDPNFVGATTQDFDGEPRFAGAAPDLGCDEFGFPELLGTREDLLMTTLVNGGGDPRGFKKIVSTGDSIEIMISSPDGLQALRVIVLLGEIFQNSTPPTGIPSFPELHLSLSGVTIILDGFTDPIAPIAVPSTGAYSRVDTLPFSVPGSTLRLQAIAFNPTAANHIFAATDAIDFVMQ